jgi:hypothetical protein
VLAGPSARSETIVRHPSPWARATAILAAIAVVVLPIFSSTIIERTRTLTGDVPAVEPPAGITDADEDPVSPAP